MQAFQVRLGVALAARTLIRFTIDVALLLVGMRVLYVEGASTILGGGVTPLLAFLLWGVASDATASALSNFRK